GTLRLGSGPAAVIAQRDERDRVLALALQRLHEADDLSIEVRQSHYLLICERTLHRRGDADAAQGNGGQDRNDDQQKQPRGAAPVLRGAPWAGGGWLQGGPASAPAISQGRSRVIRGRAAGHYALHSAMLSGAR